MSVLQRDDTALCFINADRVLLLLTFDGYAVKG